MPKVRADELSKAWIIQSSELGVGESIFLPQEDKASAQHRMRSLISAREEMSKINSLATATLRIFITFRDKRWWTVVEKSAILPSDGFIKLADGGIKRVTLTSAEDRKRQVKLMIADGIDPSEIADTMGMSELERLHFFPDYEWEEKE